ncbi:MAG: hypothetical protein CVV51_12835, partial [Spirochaetae bacterium HGW-Spirochaetae-7]
TLLSRHSLGNGTIKMLPFRSLRWGMNSARHPFRIYGQSPEGALELLGAGNDKEELARYFARKADVIQGGSI